MQKKFYICTRVQRKNRTCSLPAVRQAQLDTCLPAGRERQKKIKEMFFAYVLKSKVDGRYYKG
ncbi:MAG TPA: hypothetical protein VJ946_14170, partial [Bacteroidales bacterium]|nr:hypothetical protein [Bacteroidales bacterium]